MPREALTDRRLKSLKPAPEGSDRYEIADAIVPGLRVRVNEAGKKTFVLLARFPASTTGKRKSNADGRINPTRRTIGVYVPDTSQTVKAGSEKAEPEIGSLEAARKKARQWLEMLERGVDPQVHIAELKAKEKVRQDNTFGAVFEDYVSKKIYAKDGVTLKLRDGLNIERGLRAEFVDDKVIKGKSNRKRPGLKNRPITGITKADIIRVVDDKTDEGFETMAHSLFAWVRAFFNWAIDRGTYGIEASPCDRLKPKVLIGERIARDRVLNDEEIRALWMATQTIGHPYGQVYQILLLTGLRKREVSDADRGELVTKDQLWTIPKERMKGSLPHHVPLTKQLAEIFESLTTHNAGSFLFSTTAGKKAVNGFSKAKTILDREMLAALKKMAVARGDDPEKIELRPFVIHDLRRTMRTRLSSLGVAKEVAEAIIAHKKKGVHAVYDQWEFLDEKRAALELWGSRLRTIVEPPPANVIPLRA